MKAVAFLNEKGNAVAKVRNAMKAEVENKLIEVLEDEFQVIKNADSGFSLPVATDEASGAVIYARVDFTISVKDPAEKKEKKVKEKTEAEAVVVDLFSDEDEDEASESDAE